VEKSEECFISWLFYFFLCTGGRALKTLSLQQKRHLRLTNQKSLRNSIIFGLPN
jgi:hypothetical protein